MATNAELFKALGVEPVKKKSKSETLLQERVLEGFEDIQLFFEKKRRLPQAKGEDIFEKRYAVRLRRIYEQPQIAAIVASSDTQGLLSLYEQSLNTDANGKNIDLAKAALKATRARAKKRAKSGSKSGAGGKSQVSRDRSSKNKAAG